MTRWQWMARFDKEDTLVLAAEAAAALITDDAKAATVMLPVAAVSSQERSCKGGDVVHLSHN